jgi:hypothetical protein
MTSLIYESADETTSIADYGDQLCISTYSTGGWLGRGGGFLTVDDAKKLVETVNDWIEKVESKDE